VPTTRPILREERDVKLDESIEQWRVEWREPPRLVCLGRECACSDFMYAQRGEATLIRSRDGQTIQVFSLDRVFQTGFDAPERAELESILPAWPIEDGDSEISNEQALAEVVRSRTLVPLMALHDYDHDGRATEFLLPIGGVGCAFHGRVAVGVSRRLPQMHVFGTAAHPDKPIVLRARGWEVLRNKTKGTYVDVPCGDRGSTTQTEVELRTDSAGIHIVEREYSCPRYPERLLSRVEQ
jgi:hypothetical protein